MHSPFTHLEELTAIATARACHIAKAYNHKRATADDLFLGIYDAVWEEPIRDTFCTLIGLPDSKLEKQILKIYTIEDRYFDKYDKRLEPDHYRFVEPIESKIIPFHKKENTKLDLLMLLDRCIDDLSEELKKILKTRKTNYETIKSNIRHLIQLPIIQELGFSMILEQLDMMVEDLDLDISDISKMHIHQASFKDIEKIETATSYPKNTMDSEIIEKSDSDKVSLET